MSLKKGGFEAAMERGGKLQARVNELSKLFDPPFNNLNKKLLMNHYGIWYLFGKKITLETTDDEIIKIVRQTPADEYDGKIDFFGNWRANEYEINKYGLGVGGKKIRKHQRIFYKIFNLIVQALKNIFQDKMPENIKNAHKYSSNHKSKLKTDNICGCFYCLSIFNPNKIETWLETEETTLCPYCGIDSVIGESSGFPITRAFLKQMNKYWFKKTKSYN